MLSCTRRIEFDAAHRVIGHQGKCNKLHGHRYVVEATFSADNLSVIGMVVDFSEIKSILGGWIEHNWDHNAILSIDDKEIGDFLRSKTGQEVYYLQQNPTAEVMSSYLLNNICPRLFKDKNIVCIKIRIYETPNCYSDSCL